MTEEMINDEIRYLEDYLLLCNQVLRQNGDRFPYKEIWRACACEMQDQELVLGLREGARNRVMSVCFHLDQFHWTPLHLKLTTKTPFYLSKKDIELLLESPEKFCKKPFLMNWEWLQVKSNTLKA
ncbi:hypothetical protein QGN29_05285 [Temperatibacter marinus]|uniref:Uncharacterized protein n=1 Tax=Temperatibacter marinus TaxID=1456591 RepID=A0AA52HAN5_9PROT|nr:hypothetical protein [Temperatibacter marinus]WND03787.1 hypothetical protein QGN29_05285 [Temperatibacter marinus]